MGGAPHRDLRLCEREGGRDGGGHVGVVPASLGLGLPFEKMLDKGEEPTGEVPTPCVEEEEEEQRSVLGTVLSSGVAP